MLKQCFPLLHRRQLSSRDIYYFNITKNNFNSVLISIFVNVYSNYPMHVIKDND